MKRLVARWIGPAVLTLAGAGWVFGQQPSEKPAPAPAEKPAEAPAPGPAGPPAEKPAAKPAPGPENARFDEIFAQWKTILAELRKLYEEYQVAEAAQRPEIEKQYAQLIKQGEALEPQVVGSAERAYAEAPEANPQVAEFLLAIAQNAIKRDDYEPALRLAVLLLEKGCPDKRLDNWAAHAAFCVGQYEAALKYFERAKAAGTLRPLDNKNELNAVADQFLRDPAPFKEAWEREQKAREAEAKADDLPRVRLTTNRGDLVIELFENEAPNTVANFISLVEKGFYNGLTFHRVLEAFMAQGGCPQGNGRGGPGYHIPCECYQANRRQHFRGTLSMAHAGRDTGGSQFFLTFIPTSFLDTRIDPKTGEPEIDPQTQRPHPGHTVFGRVIEGMDVLAKIRRRSPDAPDAPPPDRILKAEVVRKRPHPYQPKKVEE